MSEYIEIGVITGTHGVKGDVKIVPLTDYPERFKDMKTAHLQSISGAVSVYDIKEVRYHKNTVIMKFPGIDDMDEALKLKNFKVVVDRKDAVKLPEDTYYIFDLIGCAVYEEDELLGKVKDVLKTGSNDVYAVQTEDKDLLIPALGWVVLDVDIVNKIIKVKLPKGLREI